jgi:predicted transcriptional regulator of viral defense system
MSPSSTEQAARSSRRAPDFAFLTNHGKTLLVIAHDPRIRMRDIAALLHITERATQRIVAELAEAGYIDRERNGRRNLYSIKTHMPVGLPTQRDIDIEALLAILHRNDLPGGTPLA